jgi:hypothetical protein
MLAYVQGVAMKPSSKSRQSPSRLPSLSERLLSSYALAASSAGVSLLVLAKPAEAKIIYTPSHIKIVSGLNHFTPLDLNNDGKPDFWFMKTYGHSSVSFLELYRSVNQGSNEPITGARNQSKNFAAALPFGVQIGPSKVFAEDGITHMASRVVGKSTFNGEWANGGKGFPHRYLGLKFEIDDKIHFGWARLKIIIKNHVMSAYITGYAYETIANRPLTAGQIKETNENVQDAKPSGDLRASNPPQATLGALALGSPGLSIWRRKETLEGN